MPDCRRQVLTLPFVHGFPQADIARRLGLSEAQVVIEIAAGVRTVAASRKTRGGGA